MGLQNADAQRTASDPQNDSLVLRGDADAFDVSWANGEPLTMSIAQQHWLAQATRVPLVFAGPGIPAARTVSAPVELIDVFPTLVQLAGFEAPMPLDAALTPSGNGSYQSRGRNRPVRAAYRWYSPPNRSRSLCSSIGLRIASSTNTSTPTNPTNQLADSSNAEHTSSRVAT